MYELLAQDKDTLGEACGIFAGDGSLYATARSYVLEVRGSRRELPYYSNHVKPLFEKLFSRKLTMIRRSYRKGYVIGIRVCGREAVRMFHTFLEFPIGKKTHNVKIPKLVLNNHECWKAYVRGVFDTDGSVYLRRTGKGYKNPVIDISSRSMLHLVQLREILRDLGFAFWLEKGNFKIRIAGRKNVERFFKEIKPHNITKIEKFKYLERKIITPEQKSHNIVPEMAEILGLLCAEGSHCKYTCNYDAFFKNRGKNGKYYRITKHYESIDFTNLDKDMLELFRSLMKRLYEYSPRPTGVKTSIKIRLVKKSVIKDLLKYTEFGCMKWDVPKILFDSSNNSKYSFLRGLFDGDGHFLKTEIQLKSINKIGIRNVSRLLDSIGIKNKIRGPHQPKGNRRPYFVLVIPKSHILKYKKLINSSHKNKSKIMNCWE